MAVTSTGSEEFRRAAAALRGADKKVLAEVAKSMRATAKPVVGEIRSAVRATTSSSTRGNAASVERQLHTLSRRGGPLKPLTERQAGSLRRRVDRMASLREGIASATGSSVSTGPDKVNLTFRVRSSQMPPSQRKLPRRWNKSAGWRHPVYGNRNVWVKQTGGPYFDKTITAHAADLRDGVVAGMQAAAQKIVNPEGAP